MFGSIKLGFLDHLKIPHLLKQRSHCHETDWQKSSVDQTNQENDSMRIAVMNRGMCFLERYFTVASGSHSISLEPSGYLRTPTDRDLKQTSISLA